MVIRVANTRADMPAWIAKEAADTVYEYRIIADEDNNGDYNTITRYNGEEVGNIKRTVPTYAVMQSMLETDNPAKAVEYTVLEDESNGGVIGHYTHYQGNLTYFAEGDIK